MLEENIKIYARISGVSIYRWISVMFFATLITLIFFLVAFFQNLYSNSSSLINLVMHNPCGFLIIAGAPFFMILYVLIANKIAVQSMIHGIWNKKAVQFIEPEFKRIVAKLFVRQGWMTEISNAAVLKAKLLAESRNDKSLSTFNRRIINYVLKKINYDDIDFTQKELSLLDILTTKFMNYISENIKPDFTMFWILMGVQVLVFIFSLFFYK